jgi:hypothetical protein
MSKQEGGLRFNEGKTRYDLVPAYAQEQYARILTMGAQKYAERNWEKGMAWSKIIASLERHLQAIKRGEDYDKESGMLHAAHVMCNAAFLTEYYKIYPEGDDRPHTYLQKKRVGTDIDDVLADFINAFCRRFNLPENPSCWEFTDDFWGKYLSIQDDKDFWLGLDAIVKPEDIEFEPVVYITSRPENLRAFTEEWLFKIKGYPVAPVVMTTDKVKVYDEYKLDRFIDDKYDTFLKMNKAGQTCFLFSHSSNARYDVGHKRIDLKTINRIL